MTDNSNYLEVQFDRDTSGQLMENRRKEKKFTDVQLKMGDKLFHAHRVALSLYSPVLEALISDQWSTTNICPLSDEYLDVEIMEDLLTFLYTGKIKLTPENVHPICMAAHFLQISNLLETSARYLCQFVTIENALILFQFATACELESLNFSCLRFVKENVEKLYQSSQILQLPVKVFRNLVVGLNDHFAGSVLRKHTFRGIIGWIENDSERLSELPVLLANIPLEELPLEFLTETVSNHSLVKESNSCIETVTTALANYQTYLRTLNPRQNLIVFGGQNLIRECSQTMSCYDSRTKVWRKLPDLPSNRFNFCATVTNQQDIIVCGGYIYNNHSNWNQSIEMFEWSKQAWTKLPDMPIKLDIQSVATMNDHLYVLGKENSNLRLWNSPLDGLCYSFQTKQWKKIKTMNGYLFSDREKPKLIGYKNRLYALGGGSFIIEYYDTAEDKWKRMKDQSGEDEFRATLHQNKIYALGESFRMYDPETDVWTSLPMPEVNKFLLSMNNKLLAVGGDLRGGEVNDSIYEFDPSTQEWSEYDKINTEMVFHEALVGAFY